MTIGIDARFFGPRGKGLGRYTQKLIETLEKIDRQNDYVIFLRRENFNEFRPENRCFKKVLADYRWYSLAEQIFLPLAIYRQKIDLMHFPHFNVPILYMGRFIVTIHDLILRHFPTRRASTLGPVKYWLKSLAYRMVFRLAIKRAKKIVTVSNYVKNDLIKCFRLSSEKVIVTYEGAPEEAMGNKLQALSLKEYGIKKPYLLYVGNAYPHKNLERLISAFNILTGELKKVCQLVLVGEEDYFYRRLKNQLDGGSKSGQVIFTDFVPDESLEIFYRNASLYVFPSLCEGFGLPPLEAMSFGVPVISSNATCLPEILGESAIYFDPYDSSDMAKKINLILSDENLRQELVIKGSKQIKKYSWRKMGEETLKTYLFM